MEKQRLFILLFWVSFAMLTGCKKDSVYPLKQEDTPQLVGSESIVLGKKLKNPYSVENMLKAYELLLQKEGIRSDLEIDTTHFYVRFLPLNDEEYDVIAWDDSTIELFDYPLDYEIIENGEHYHDPSVSSDNYTWQYCVVPKNYRFPNLRYEIIEALCLPEGMENGRTNKDLLRKIERIAFEITDNTNDMPDETLGRWSPSGKIEVWDDYSATNRGVSGAKVRAKRWFTVKTAFTNSTGNYSISHNFGGSVDFSIVWESGDYDIRDGNWGQATYNGPNNVGSVGWNATISSGASWMHAHVQRAADYYYYHNTFGLKKPTDNNFWTKKLKIAVKDKDNRAFFAPALRWLTFPEIMVYKGSTYTDPFTGSTVTITNDSRRLYQTTIHEIAHASHWDMVGHSRFQQTDDKVVESWALGVASQLTNSLYGAGVAIDGQWADFDDLSTDFEGVYLPVVIDLIDNYNQRAANAGNIDYPIDRTNGYTLEQIEDALDGPGGSNGAKTLTQWRDNLKNQTANPTESFVDELFDNYINL